MSAIDSPSADAGDEPVRIGIIGLGNIGHYHADRLRDLPVNLVGGIDISAEARERFAEKYETQVFDTADALFAIDVDGVIITTPNQFHEEYAVAAFEADIAVLLEKPLAHTLESAERIAEAAENADTFCMVGFHTRFYPSIQAIKGYQDEGRFGEIRHIEADFIRRRGVPERGTWFTTKEVAGGGALIDIGVHAIDLALYIHGFPALLEVSATTRSQFGAREDYTYLNMWGEDTGTGQFDVEDSISAFLRCADSKTIALEVAWAANRPASEAYFIRGTEAGARFDRDTESLTVYESSPVGADHLSDTTLQTRLEDAFTAEQRVFVDGVRTGTAPNQNTVEQALTVQRVIDAIYRSAAEEQAVSSF
ncbi:Gfo/Idh/MocA family protein [Haladaptatus halobius]|uniref:Gfo/Idh/MocA family protein n=1 Tax=Haladaptatus halobius TaxID=2884875 RepID=UPI001D0A82EF|nr:Gfo/Idh/MocA family oxidoreductase [Haladaptatus halobius]